MSSATASASSLPAAAVPGAVPSSPEPATTAFPFVPPPARDRLPPPWRAEGPVLQALAPQLEGRLHWNEVVARAAPWVEAVRHRPAPFWAMESLLQEYPISGPEGLALMRLAEALLRVPDTETAIALTADQLGRADFASHAEGHPHPVLAGLSASALALSKKLLPQDAAGAGLLQRLGARSVVAATVRALQLLGRQFVLGQTIGEARAQAAAQRREQPRLRFSYDMLGEGARTEADAQRHLDAYAQALAAIAADLPGGAAVRPEDADGVSIKLSALHSRYEAAQRERVFEVLLPRVWSLCGQAARANLNLTIDAEESDRLELSLDLLDVLCARIAREHPGWQGFGLALQAYQTRAPELVQEVVRIARAHGLRLMVRLVKGAYWDGEIKRAQELGLAGYPVFTRKAHTDLAYLACAQRLLDAALPGADGAPPAVFPQFATHNAATIAAVLQMAQACGAPFEMQRLHGMGEGIYRKVMRGGPGAVVPALRVYAPVGEHRDLLAYLVRRLLENGANSSFVHRLADERVAPGELLASPLLPPGGPGLPLPVALYGPGRPNAAGRDLASLVHRAPLLAAARSAELPAAPEASPADAAAAMARLHAAFPTWNARPLAERAAVLRRAADLLEGRMDAFGGLLVREARKTPGDAVAEVREAVDFCRYYAQQAEARLAPLLLPGPTGERNELRLHGRGVFVCISPWNFPLAIFAGQVVAALVCGNTVAAKPAEQTPGVARRFVELLHEAGLPREALALLHGPGETLGAALVADARTAGVCFTGSTAVARHIHRSLAAQDGPIVPLVAETGGINAMIVDSSALPEQVIDAVVQSAFRSAGQRCSALRLLCVHDSVADALLAMLVGAMAGLRLGDPADFATDVGPVIDAEAHAGLMRHVQRLEREARLVARTPRPAGLEDGPQGHFVAPVAFEIADLGTVREEIFGPVLQVLRWRGDPEALVARINALGWGLTLGVQTRIDRRAERIAAAARIGNVYVNRNMIGAVVGVQPFGGEGLSGTGPKAGGPNYLPRFCAEQVLTVNTAAAGGNASLLAGGG